MKRTRQLLYRCPACATERVHVVVAHPNLRPRACAPCLTCRDRLRDDDAATTTTPTTTTTARPRYKAVFVEEFYT